MDPKDLPEEHRKYLELEDNPKRVSMSAVFKLVSDSMIKIQERLSIVETKQDQSHQQISKLDERVCKATDELDKEQRQLRADFEADATASAKINGTFEERFTWQDRMQKVFLVLLLSILGFLFTIFGIPIPLP